ncbi:HNH endonuclease signature motif containing protein [Corynebacterium casei]|uniref:HNH endonuclease signature motif containing protein n=1 Tax=Corynebacterium casei TaxID=160386 RepID=UPI003FD4911E
MNKFKQFIALSRQGVSILRDCFDMSPYDMASEGMSLNLAKQYSKLADVYFGSADSTRVQRESVALAEQRELSVAHLLMIEKHATKINRRGGTWKLRAELIAFEGSYEKVDAYGARRVKEIEGEKPKEAGVRFSRPKNGMRTVTITDDQRNITNYEKTLEANITSDKPRSKALLDAFWKHAEGESGIAKPIYRPVIAIGLDKTAKIISGHGDDQLVGSTDGTTLTGAEFVNAAMEGELGDKLYVGLFHPTKGPVNLYEARFASDKQRILAMAENLVCPWPNCAVPADRCQVHHLDAHKNGGPTNPENLTMVCKYHNGVNNDSGEGKRGKMRRHRGKVRLQTPGGKIVANTQELSSMGAMDLI